MIKKQSLSKAQSDTKESIRSQSLKLQVSLNCVSECTIINEVIGTEHKEDSRMLAYNQLMTNQNLYESGLLSQQPLYVLTFGPIRSFINQDLGWRVNVV